MLPEKNQEFINSFNTSLEVGKVGERMFAEFIQSKWPGVIVEDVANNPAYQWSEIDYILHYPSGQTRTVELKTDAYAGTGNFAIEIVANKEINRPGWIWSSTADLLAYFFVNGVAGGGDNLFIMPMEEMRRILHKNPYLKQREVTPERQLRGEGMKTTIVKLVPRILVKGIANTYSITPQNVKNSHSAQAGWKQ